MKKILVMMVVVGAIAHGRDFEYNGKRDVERYIKKVDMINIDRGGRSICGEWDRDFDSNIERYPGFHNELRTQYRGHQGR